MKTLVEMDGFYEDGTTKYNLSLSDDPESTKVKDGIRIKDKRRDISVIVSRSELVEAVHFLEEENDQV